MPETSTPRPAQVTIAAWLVMAGSVIVVLTAFDQIAGLRSLETREAVEEFISKPPGDNLGLGVQGMLSVMRVMTMVTAACATAAAILGFHVLRRSRAARLVLTVLAAPLFLAGMVVGGFLPAVIVGSITMLWFQPARDWIDGKAPRAVPAPPAPPPPSPLDEPPTAAPPVSPSGARPYPGFGEAQGAAGVPVDAGVPSTSPTAYAVPPRPAAPPRPPALMWACALAWAGSAVVFVVMLISVAVVLAAPDLLVDELYRQNPELRSDGITPATLRSTVLFAGTLLIIWSVVATALAAFAWRGRPWAWTALLVSACSASVLCLLAALGSPAMLVPTLVCAATIPLLLRPDVRAFIRGSTAAR